MNHMAHRARSKGTLTLPGIDCGLCGQRTCKSFAVQVYKGFARLDRCPQLGRQGTSLAASGACVGGAGLAKPSWKDSLGRRYDLLLEPFPGDPGPRETILPHNPLLVKTLRIKEGDLLLGRPMGGCGCPVTH